MTKKCNTCGAVVPDTATVCPYCGNAVSQNVVYQQDEIVDGRRNVVDEPSGGLNFLSFLIPLAGWIMYFVFRDETPQKAKACSKWAWIGFAVVFVFELILGILLADY